MNARTPLSIVALVLALLPAAARAQGGKIDDVERHAQGSGGRSDNGDGGGGGFLGGLFRALFGHHGDAPTPADTAPVPARSLPEQTYGRYPWGGPRLDERFVTRSPEFRPRFGVSTVTYFRDAASSLGAISADIEGGFEGVYLAFNLTEHREHLPYKTDYLTSLRGELGGIGQLGRGFGTIGVGGRAVCLDTDVCAYGADFSLGARVLPLRPFVLTGNARVGGMKWHDSGWFWVTEYNTTASLILGRVEVGGGWHWLKLGSATAFGGPIVVGRVWF